MTTGDPAPIDPEEELATGSMVGDYRIEKRIGWGGMGIVYGAVHPMIGKRAAIKVLNARYCADQESVSRFVREAQAVNKVGHANIVDIFAIGELADGRSYLVMEWLQGETLMDRLEREPLPLRVTIEILIALTRALEAAHNAGVIHRDLKPENVFLIPEDDIVRVKLLDFGIAKLETRRAPTRQTATGMTVGTPLYMSPEQAKGVAIDGRTDIYSLGVLAYAMVCRTTPFEREGSPVEILHAHISKPPVPPRKHAPDLSPALDTLILQMLSKDAADRPPLAEVRRRLKAIDGGSFETHTAESLAPQAGTIHIASPPRRRWPLAVAGALVVLGAAAAFAIVETQRDEPHTQPAPQPAPEPPPVTTGVPPPPAPPEVEPPQPAPGTIELVVQPAGATVSIDGQRIELDQGRARIELPDGEHEVTASAAGYRASEQTVAVLSARVTPLTIKLVKQRAGRHRRPKDVDAVVNPFKKHRR